MKFAEIREQVFKTTNDLCASNLIRLSAGNVSLRDAEGHVAITPSGVKYDVMRPDDIVVIDYDGNIIAGNEGLKPSSEFRLHTGIMRQVPGVNAVIHTHSIYGITFATLGMDIPPVCIELMIAGAPIPVVPFTTPGTDEVGDEAARVFLERPELNGLLMKHHGMAAIGATLDEAYSHAMDIETGAQVYYQALQLGKPDTIPAEQIELIRKKYNLVAADRILA